MPELPEVETVVRGLQLTLPSRRIVDVRLGKTDFIDDPAMFGELLPGRSISGVSRFGKYICVELSPLAQGTTPKAHPYLLIHLGMTGRLTTVHPSEPIRPHTHVFFALDDGNELRYTDIRRFGEMRLASEVWMDELRARWGQDALEIGMADFAARIGSRAASIKALLLDQRAVRGIGNIYADESLWRASIHPARRADRLTREQLAALHRAIRATLRAAIRMRGSSFSDYVDAKGKPGRFQSMHRVYQKEDEACSRCGKLIARTKVAGRSSYFCPKCQPAPRGRKKTARKKIARTKSSRRK